MYIIIGIIMYVITGMVMDKVVKNYVSDLERKPTAMNVRPYDLKFTVEGPIWLGLLIISLASIFWPISLIAVILKAEWEYSGLKPRFTKE